jgi:hypothetical protein
MIYILLTLIVLLVLSFFYPKRNRRVVFQSPIVAIGDKSCSVCGMPLPEGVLKQHDGVYRCGPCNAHHHGQ